MLFLYCELVVHTKNIGISMVKSKSEDLIGKKFNMLTVNKFVGKNKFGKYLYECTCDCGNKHVVIGSHLKDGSVKSCGCYNLKKISERFSKDLFGKRFGKLIVIEKTDLRIKGKIVWKCKCDCGNECFVQSNNLITGNTKSCGCLTRTKDLTGKKFGRLTVLEKISKLGDSSVLYRCKCTCGNECTVYGQNLRRGDTRSCGCLKKELLVARCKTHGMSNTRIYNIWRHMIGRCYDENNIAYYKYGAKGITVCSEWHVFGPFVKWAKEHGYTDDLSIDRIDNTKNYTPDNCKWSTVKEQARNKIRTIKLSNGIPLAQFCEENNLNYKHVYNCYRNKLSEFEQEFCIN